jgi:hypothetical protein
VPCALGDRGLELADLYGVSSVPSSVPSVVSSLCRIRLYKLKSAG